MNIYKIYKNEISYEMIKLFKYKSIMQVPKIYKITLNMGVGKMFCDKKLLESSLKDLSNISGQKPKLIKAKKSISNFKTRKGFFIGCKVTLRKFKMWIFIKKLIYLSIPKIKNFKGLSIKSFDKNGNYNIGIKDYTIFPEIVFNSLNKNKGMDISISIKTTSIDESLTLLKLLNFPFK